MVESFTTLIVYVLICKKTKDLFIYYIYMKNFINKFKRAISKEHDYVKFHSEYDKVFSALSKAKRGTWEAAKQYADNWAILTGHREGLHFLGLFPWLFIATITGRRKYHQNFLESFNFWIGQLQQIVDEKDEKYQDGQSKIGFISR